MRLQKQLEICDSTKWKVQGYASGNPPAHGFHRGKYRHENGELLCGAPNKKQKTNKKTIFGTQLITSPTLTAYSSRSFAAELHKQVSAQSCLEDKILDDIMQEGQYDV